MYVKSWKCKMASQEHATKRTAQTVIDIVIIKPIKSARSKHNNTPKRMEGEEPRRKKVDLEDIHEMMKAMMKKLDTLDIIEERLKSVEHDINDVKESIEFAHGEIDGQQNAQGPR